MGNKYTVAAWVVQGEGYGYETVYTGESLIAAIVHMCLSKRKGSCCIKLEVRHFD